MKYFYRKPRKGFSFSIESIFSALQHELKDVIRTDKYICKFYNDGYFTKFLNIIGAGYNQTHEGINHVTGELHFINLLFRKKGSILTIHDCGMVHRKSGIKQKIIVSLYLKLPVARAQIVTTVSEQTKREIIKYTACAPNKIKVIPVFVSTKFSPYPKDFNKSNPVILQIGTAYNKNLERLIEAVATITCKLYIIGKLSSKQKKLLEYYSIEFENVWSITDDEMIEAYQNCDLVSFISTFEGFGMPIVEANVVERPVITSKLSSMPEVASSAACLVDPYSISEIRQGILKIIKDDAYRETLVRAGRINRKRFDLKLIATQYLNLYKELN